MNDDQSTPCIWVSTTVNNINAIQSVIRKEFTPQWRDRRSAEDVEWSKRMVVESGDGWKRSEILTGEQVGDIWYYDSKAEYYTAPFISGGRFPLVSETAKAVLEQYDLGDTVFHPLTLMHSSESYLTTPEPYYLLNVGNKQSIGNYEALGPEGDNRAPLRNRHGIVFLPNSDRESELVVVPEALDGPDIWLDPLVPSLLFLSDRLVTGLKDAGVDKGWGLVRASVEVL